MAITIEYTPADNLPVYNNVTWVASSTNTGQTAFKYIVDIYINAAKVYRARIVPEPDNAYLEVDIASVLADYITKTLWDETATDGVEDGENGLLNYEVRFGEEYEVASVLTQFPDLDTQTGVVFNGALQYVDFVDYDSVNYLDTTFLTNAPRTQTTDLYGTGALHLMLDSATTLTNYTIETYLAGVLQNTYTVDTFPAAKEMYLFASGVDAINNIDPANFTVAPTQPILTNAIDRYDITANLSTGATETFVFNIVERCEEEQSKRLHFLNRLGGYDYFDFTLAWRENYQVERKQLVQKPNRLDSGGGITYSKKDRARRSYCVTEKTICSLTSNWITQAQSEWLKEIISSPDVYIEENGELIAVNVLDSSYEPKKEQYDQLFNLELQVEFSIDNGSQRG